MHGMEPVFAMTVRHLPDIPVDPLTMAICNEYLFDLISNPYVFSLIPIRL